MVRGDENHKRNIEMNYGSNATLLEMDTKNRYGISTTPTRGTQRSTSAGSETSEHLSSQNRFSTLAKLPGMDMIASLAAAVIVGGLVTSAVIVA